MSKKQAAIECICALIIILFLYASISKLLDFKRFTNEINNQPLPNRWTPFLIHFIPAIEILTCLFMLFEKTRLIGLYLSAALMLIFSIYATIILLRFFAFIPCACGGLIHNLTWPQHLLLNIIYLCLSLTGTLLHHQKKPTKTIPITKNNLV